MIACCVLAGLGVFFPAIEVRPGLAAHFGSRAAKKTTLSLAHAASDRELARRVLAAYRASHGQHLGARVLDAIEPHSRGRIKDAIDDAHDAMDTLGEISDDDAKTYGTALAAAIWLFIATEAVIALVVLVQAVGGIYRRGRIIGAAIVALVGAALGIALWFGCKQVVFEINDELSYAITELGAGAWLVLVGSVGALGSGIALLAARRHASPR